MCPMLKVGSNGGYRSRSLPDLTGHLTARADDGHAPPLGLSSKAFNLTFILPVASGEILCVELD